MQSIIAKLLARLKIPVGQLAIRDPVALSFSKHASKATNDLIFF